MPRKHPLAEATDAARWDAEAPLGRIVLVAHAAFLDAGFLPYPYANKPPPHQQLPTQVGLTASTLHLRYSVPELMVRHRRTAAVLRLRAHGDLLILYGYLTGAGGRADTRWACVDARLVAPVLSGDLGEAARALASDALGARVWNELAGGLARLLFVDICTKILALLPPRLVSLPADLQAAILTRLDGVDLAMVECTCTELRDLVAGRGFWRARYNNTFSEPSLEIDGESLSWKERYASSRRQSRISKIFLDSFIEFFRLNNDATVSKLVRSDFFAARGKSSRNKFAPR